MLVLVRRPGPLVVALKVAQNQDPSDPSKYWPPSEPDQVETIAARYDVVACTGTMQSEK